MSASDNKQPTPAPLKTWGEAPEGTKWKDLLGVLGAVEVAPNPQPIQPLPAIKDNTHGN